MDDINGCCKRTNGSVSEDTRNRPGLDVLSYRLGTHASFLAAMKDRLSDIVLEVDRDDGKGKTDLFPLKALTTRESDDFSIALLDAWALVGDVLTFYEEQIANEGYLRTAVELRSVLELAKLIGYRLNPGISSSVDLAFILEKGYDAGIPQGIRVQSLPAPGEASQTFETSESITARAEWNKIKPRLTQPQMITYEIVSNSDELVIYFSGLDINLIPNQLMMFVFDGEKKQVLRLVKSVEPQVLDKKTKVTLQNVLQISPDNMDTKNVIGREGGSSGLPNKYPPFDPDYRNRMIYTKVYKDPSDMGVYVFRLKASPFGHNAPAKLINIKDGGGVSSSSQNAKEDPNFLYLDGSYEKIVSESWIVIQALKRDLTLTPEYHIRRAKMVTPSISQSKYGITGKATRIQFDNLNWKDLDIINDQTPLSQLGEILVYAQSENLTSKLAEEPIGSDLEGKLIELDGYYDGLEAGQQLILSGLSADDIEMSGLLATERIEIASIFHGLRSGGYGSPAIQLNFIGVYESNDDYIYKFSVENWTSYLKDMSDSTFIVKLLFVTNDIHLLDSNIKLKLKSVDDLKDLEFSLAKSYPIASSFLFYIVLTDGKNKVSYISNLAYQDPAKNPSPSPEFSVTSYEYNGKTTKYKLNLANWFDYHDAYYTIEVLGEGLPSKILLKDISNKGLINLSFDSDRSIRYFYITMKPQEDDSPIYISNLISAEIKTFLPGDSPHTTLVLTKDLSHYYKRDSVVIYANLAHATHGETRNEVLGSGDGSQALQEFPLHQRPLTYFPAPTPKGAASTLKVRVNDIFWHEAESLFDMGPNDRKFITKTDDQGKTRVIFGNGVEGLRPPTGVENIKAVYRTGIGKVGNVKAGQISLLMTRPLGVKGVINPMMAEGGVDPEGMEQARRNAPLAVMALDRLVSVQDYEDFARNYTGIGKASASRLSDGRREVVHLSIAGIDDVPIDPDSDLFKNLFSALRRYGDPRQPVRMDVCERMLLFIKANVGLDPDYLWSSVGPKIRAALREAFSFDKREPGQDVMLSEAISAIQHVPGVVYVDIDLLDSISETEALDPAEAAKKMKSLLDGDTKLGDEAKVVPDPRITVNMARFDEKGGILPAQIAYLSPDIPESIVLKELI